ncbi:hypothetical protein GCM10009087_36390 [Sphingomonas oligophenolica]|uniref:Uncharacterized protein n=1 Tax=Sphingomonas oligophenolica TaxID=301154 RepID=A0ABU9Y960_9SPHN
MRRSFLAFLVGASLALAPAAQARALSDERGTVAQWRARTSVAQDWLDGRFAAPWAARVTYDGPPITMRFSAHNPANASVVRDVFIPAFEVLRRMSRGKLLVAPSWEGNAHSLADGWAALANGRTDMTACYASLEADKRGFRLLTLLDLPGLFPNAAVATAVSERLYARWFNADFARNGVMIARMKATGPAQLYLRARPDPEADIVGLSIASADGVQADFLRAVGARPALMPSPQVREAIAGGRLQGVAITDAAAQVYGITGEAKFALEGDLGRTNLEYCMSPAFYRQLPPDLRTILNAWLRAEAQAETQVFYGREGASARDAYAATGGMRLRLSSARSRQWKRMGDLAERDAVARLEGEKLPARAFMREVRRLTAVYAKRSDNELMRDAAEHPISELLP